jgi:hypothetical protein
MNKSIFIVLYKKGPTPYYLDSVHFFHEEALKRINALQSQDEALSFRIETKAISFTNMSLVTWLGEKGNINMIQPSIHPVGFAVHPTLSSESVPNKKTPKPKKRHAPRKK